MGVLVDYVQKRRPSGRLEYRRAFPVPLRHHLGREFVRSLKAAHLKEPGVLERYRVG